MEDLAKAAEMKGLIRDLELECSNGWSLLRLLSYLLDTRLQHEKRMISFVTN
jgi:hypothetical protein